MDASGSERRNLSSRQYPSQIRRVGFLVPGVDSRQVRVGADEADERLDEVGQVVGAGLQQVRVVRQGLYAGAEAVVGGFREGGVVFQGVGQDGEGGVAREHAHVFDYRVRGIVEHFDVFVHRGAEFAVAEDGVHVEPVVGADGILDVGVIVHAADEVAAGFGAQAREQPRPGDAGAEQVHDHAVRMPGRAEVFQVTVGWLEQAFAGGVQVGRAALREKLLVQVMPEQAVAADEEDLANARRAGVAFQVQAGQEQQGEVQLAGQEPEVAFVPAGVGNGVGQPNFTREVGERFVAVLDEKLLDGRAFGPGVDDGLDAGGGSGFAVGMRVVAEVLVDGALGEQLGPDPALEFAVVANHEGHSLFQSGFSQERQDDVGWQIGIRHEQVAVADLGQVLGDGDDFFVFDLDFQLQKSVGRGRIQAQGLCDFLPDVAELVGLTAAAQALIGGQAGCRQSGQAGLGFQPLQNLSRLDAAPGDQCVEYIKTVDRLAHGPQRGNW